MENTINKNNYLEEAKIWWNDLHIINRMDLASKYFSTDDFGNLSNESILKIYIKEIKKEDTFLIYNSKEFEEYISKFNDEDKLQAFWDLAKLLSPEYAEKITIVLK